MQVKIKILYDYVKIPEYKTAGASGFDLSAACECKVYPRSTIKVPLGIAVQIPDGYEMQIRPRSGIESQGVLRSSVGTIDSDFTGEIHAIVSNLTDDVVRICAGDRIAQGVIAPVVRAEFVQVDKLDETERGCNGFGSTGG